MLVSRRSLSHSAAAAAERGLSSSYRLVVDPVSGSDIFPLSRSRRTATLKLLRLWRFPTSARPDEPQDHAPIAPPLLSPRRLPGHYSPPRRRTGNQAVHPRCEARL